MKSICLFLFIFFGILSEFSYSHLIETHSTFSKPSFKWNSFFSNVPDCQVPIVVLTSVNFEALIQIPYNIFCDLNETFPMEFNYSVIWNEGAGPTIEEQVSISDPSLPFSITLMTERNGHSTFVLTIQGLKPM